MERVIANLRRRANEKAIEVATELLRGTDIDDYEVLETLFSKAADIGEAAVRKGFRKAASDLKLREVRGERSDRSAFSILLDSSKAINEETEKGIRETLPAIIDLYL
jgi:hypothetical protein